MEEEVKESKKSKKSKNVEDYEEDDEVDSQDDEDIDSEMYGQESDALEKLAEGSSDEEMPAENSDIDSDEEEREIIKLAKKAPARKGPAKPLKAKRG